MAVADTLVNDIQELLDAGYTNTKVASILGIDHKQVSRAFKKYSMEVYIPFDEGESRRHLYQNFEWLWEEDSLEEIGDEVFVSGFFNLPVTRDENDIALSKYCVKTYGNLVGYFKAKKQSPLLKSVYKKCCMCHKWKNIKQYHKDYGAYMGLSSRCKVCAKENLSDWQTSNPDKVAVNRLKRRARIKNLPDDLTIEQLDNILNVFDGKCVLSGAESDLHMDHVIPLATGFGGTTYANMVPLRDDLNTSKNDSNIFEWFEANRQRFELSQDRFDNLIAWLASANAMTVEEYRKHVYWCHANPRSIDELKDAKEVI